jgi:hypothetical protein
MEKLKTLKSAGVVFQKRSTLLYVVHTVHSPLANGQLDTPQRFLFKRRQDRKKEK